jgi:ketosteroid isomerase-like protein
MTRTGAILVIIGLLSGTLSAAAHRQSYEQPVEAAVQESVDQTIEYFKTQQGAKFAEQYAPDLTACKDGKWITDTSAHVARFGEAVSRLHVHALTWTRRQVYVLAPDAAVFVGEFNETISSESSEERRDFQVAWTLLLRRISGKWKIVHEHTSHVFLDPAAER